jgi:hypothetical protein
MESLLLFLKMTEISVDIANKYYNISDYVNFILEELDFNLIIKIILSLTLLIITITILLGKFDVTILFVFSNKKGKGLKDYTAAVEKLQDTGVILL